MPKKIEISREIILLVGKEMLVEKNYKNLNIREIAKKCDIAVGTFYNYFSNKKELAVAIFEDDWYKVIKCAGEISCRDIDLKEKLRIIYYHLEKFIGEFISIFYELSSEGSRYPREKENESCLLLYKEVNNLIDFEKERGVIKSKLETENLTHFLMDNLMNISRNKYMSFDELYDHLKI